MSARTVHERPVAGRWARSAMAAGPVVLDGGLATLLEAHGHDLSSALWSARLLVEDPAAITGVAHREYFRAGAQVAITASYQASLPGFAAIGAGSGRGRTGAAAIGRTGPEAAAARHPTRRPARRPNRPVRRGPRRPARPLGRHLDRPYGAALADGSEYRGDYGLTVRQLRDWHRPRLEILADAGADVLAIETIPCLAEVEALLAEIERAGRARLALADLPTAGGPGRGNRPARRSRWPPRLDQVIAVGVNCVESARGGRPGGARPRETSGKPAVVYPNSGEEWDAAGRRWAGTVDLRTGARRGVGGVRRTAGRRLLPGRPPTAIRRLARLCARLAGRRTRARSRRGEHPDAERHHRGDLAEHQAALHQADRQRPVPGRAGDRADQPGADQGAEPGQRRRPQPARDCGAAAAWRARAPGQQQHRQRQADERDQAGHPVDLTVRARAPPPSCAWERRPPSAGRPPRPDPSPNPTDARPGQPGHGTRRPGWPANRAPGRPRRR